MPIPPAQNTTRGLALSHCSVGSDRDTPDRQTGKARSHAMRPNRDRRWKASLIGSQWGFRRHSSTAPTATPQQTSPGSPCRG
jgi:hypothetical protein